MWPAINRSIETELEYIRCACINYINLHGTRYTGKALATIYEYSLEQRWKADRTHVLQSHRKP